MSNQARGDRFSFHSFPLTLFSIKFGRNLLIHFFLVSMKKYILHIQLLQGPIKISCTRQQNSQSGRLCNYGKRFLIINSVSLFTNLAMNLSIELSQLFFTVRSRFVAQWSIKWVENTRSPVQIPVDSKILRDSSNMSFALVD